MKTSLFTFVVVILFAGIVKGIGPKNSIKLNNPNAVQYCTAPEMIAPALTIEWATQITGMKISFSEGYLVGEDELSYTGTLSQNWSSSAGSLILTGGKSNADYASAINLITYKNIKSVPTLGVRKITISLNDIDYLPATGHFYRFISHSGISWSNAQIDAQSDAMMYYGLRGYLATVTEQAENDFIKLKTQGVGWIGASDSLSEGEWRWVTGPEGLKDGGKGLLFWKGTSTQASGDPTNFGSVNGAYQNWNVGEPNNSGPNGTIGPSVIPGEDYAHITKFADPNMAYQSYRWNDLPNEGGGGVDYTAVGYLIEYGGYDGEPTLEISATLELQVNTVTFNSTIISSICQGESVTLNQADKNSVPATYSWSPSATLSNAQIANPVATPTETTSYFVTGFRGSCTNNSEFKVPVIQKPKVTFSIDSTTCYGYNLDVTYSGDANPAISNFAWTFGGEPIASGTGLIHEVIPVGINRNRRNLKLVVEQNGCSDSSTINNILVTPDLSPWTVKYSERCLPDSFQFAVTNPDPLVHYDWNFGDGNSGAGSFPTHKYLQSGKYDIQLKATNSDNCSNMASIPGMVYAVPLPIAAFSMSDSIVYSYNPTVSFLDLSTLASSWLWDFGDSITAVVQNPVHYYTAKGYRTILLKVSSEYDCKDSVSHRVLIAFDRIFPPNGFSPNAPNPVDRIFLLNSTGIRSEGYHFTVKSRWDDLIFEANNEIKGWDGRTRDGSFAPPGSYVWFLDFVDFLGSLHRQTGVVTLVY